MHIDFKKNYWFPFYFAIALLIGLILGYLLSEKKQRTISTPSLLTSSEKYPTQDLTEVLKLINLYYMDTVNNKELVNDAIRGLLNGLDPHSTFETAEENRQFMENMNNAFEGIGVQFHLQNDSLLVIAAITGGPSEKIGVRAGDRITKVDGKNIANIG